MVEDIYQGNFRKYLQMLAPGTLFRVGIENVLHANTGGLIVVGDSPDLMKLVSGGFHIDCEYTPARLYELAKMDGAIIMNSDASRILIANAQLDPDANIHSNETGIRHRTAERVARQVGVLVVAISQSDDKWLPCIMVILLSACGTFPPYWSRPIKLCKPWKSIAMC